jgi:hypothetical protein
MQKASDLGCRRNDCVRAIREPGAQRLREHGKDNWPSQVRARLFGVMRVMRVHQRDDLPRGDGPSHKAKRKGSVRECATSIRRARNAGCAGLSRTAGPSNVTGVQALRFSSGNGPVGKTPQLLRNPPRATPTKSGISAARPVERMGICIAYHLVGLPCRVPRMSQS